MTSQSTTCSYAEAALQPDIAEKGVDLPITPLAEDTYNKIKTSTMSKVKKMLLLLSRGQI